MKPLHFEMSDGLRISGVGFYQEFTGFAFEYGPTYQRAVECSHGMNDSGQEEILVKVRGVDTDLSE